MFHLYLPPIFLLFLPTLSHGHSLLAYRYYSQLNTYLSTQYFPSHFVSEYRFHSPLSVVSRISIIIVAALLLHSESQCQRPSIPLESFATLESQELRSCIAIESQSHPLAPCHPPSSLAL